MTHKVEHVGADDPWPEAVATPLDLPCGVCDRHTMFCFMIPDDLWDRLLPSYLKRGVVCLRCLDYLAESQGVNLGEHLEFVQFTGRGHTTILTPTRTVVYEPRKRQLQAEDNG